MNLSTHKATAQTRDITKDTTEIRIFFKNPAIFSPEEMKEFDLLWNQNLKSDIGDFVLDYILINFDVKTSDYETTAMTCILLDPDRKTSLGKRAYEEIMKNLQFQKVYNLMLEGIKIDIKGKELEEKGRKLDEFYQKLEEMEKAFKELGQ